MKVWIVGGTSGIGQKTAEIFTEKGWKVFSTGLELDVQFFPKLYEYVINNCPFDCCVFSAGVNKLVWSENIDIEDFRYIYDTNVLGFLNVFRALYKANGNPAKIVCISSDAADQAMRGSALYCSSKAALDQIVKCIVREKAQEGWIINTVKPGAIDDTKMTEYLDSEICNFRGWDREFAQSYEKNQIPMGRRGTTEEVANLIFSISEGNFDYLNGAAITINGGR